MGRASRFKLIDSSLTRNCSCRRAALLAAILICTTQLLLCQTAPAPQPTLSLAESLQLADTGKTQLRILYIHGMGVNVPQLKAGTQDFEVSQAFREHFCKQIGCTTNEFAGREYAGAADFSPEAAPPRLAYFGEDLWKQGGTNADWRAAAPFVDHYKLVRKNGTIIYVDEINWWPIVFAAKCRQIVAQEAALMGPDRMHIKTCSAKTVPDPDHKGRFRSYAWITQEDVQKRGPSWPKAAVINRSLKREFLDWGFADALLAVGPLRTYLVEGIRELILDSFKEADNQEFIIVSHSLGSYLMFSALDLKTDQQVASIPDWQDKFGKVLSRTSLAYFMANQIRVLELADLDENRNGTLIAHFQNWSELRARAQQQPPHIIAWSDPGDVLTWQVPALKGLTVENLPVTNASRWLWLLESPTKAHENYVENKHVLREMVPKSARKQKAVAPASSTAGSPAE